MLKAFYYQLFPTKSQEELLAKHFGCSRFIWNWALSEKTKTYQQSGISLSKFELSNRLPAMKKQETFDWLKEVNSQSLQAKLEDLDIAFTSFFKKKSDYPNFKNRKHKQSFRIPQYTKVDFETSKLTIPKFLEGIKFDNHRSFSGKISSSTISKSATNKYFISILVENDVAIPTKPAIKEKTTIGIDLGITTFAAISTGLKIDNPRHLKHKLKKLCKESRKFSKTKKESKNREKQRIKLAKVHEDVSNCRKDFHHKLSHKLTHDNQVETIVMETLSIKNMIKNHKLAKHIQDCAWYQFQTFLQYKCEWYGKNFIQIGRFEPSSKLCTCGVINHELTLKDRIWTCKKCNTTHDRDLLASRNICRIGLVQPEVKACGSLKKVTRKSKSGKKQETSKVQK